jgi:hypothetical protein
MRIKRFNENASIESQTIYNVLIYKEDFMGNDVPSISSYVSEMMAADHIIKYVNAVYNQKFEVFYEGNERLFSRADDNEDFDHCINYLMDKGIKAEIIESKLSTTPKTLIEIG